MLLFFLSIYSFALVETWGPHEFQVQDDYLEVQYIDSA